MYILFLFTDFKPTDAYDYELTLEKDHKGHDESVEVIRNKLSSGRSTKSEISAKLAVKKPGTLDSRTTQSQNDLYKPSPPLVRRSVSSKAPMVVDSGKVDK